LPEPTTGAAHPFDEAIALTPITASAAERDNGAPQRWQGRSHPAYGNMVGPFGGVMAAQALNAVLQHPERQGDPVSLTVNFMAALADGAFQAETRPLRTNRSTQHWLVVIGQTDAAGAEAAMLSATVLTAKRRATWSGSDVIKPHLPAPESVDRASMELRSAWIQRYDLRIFAGDLPRTWDGAEAASLTQAWVRDDPARALDWCSLAAMADVFYPRIWLRRARATPAGTVSMTVYFHASAAELAAAGSGYLLAQARGQRFAHGFFDQTAQLWNEAGDLLVTSHQLVYFKE
jgi:acyl-CoA thioesterase